MAVYGPASVGFVLVGGYNLLSNTTELKDTIEAKTDETTVFGNTWPSHASLGVKHAALEQDGFFDDATGASNQALVGSQGVSRVFCYGLEGGTLGSKMIGYQGAMQIDYERIASLDKLHRARASYQGNGQVDQALILHALQARTVDGNSEGADSQDNAASSAAGGVGYLQVTAYSGFSSVVLKVRHSADDTTYADLITFATVTSAPTAERLTVAGTVNRHTAVSWDVTGAGSISFLVGFTRN